MQDPSLPAELQALAEVMLEVLDGNWAPDLSALPEALAAIVRQALG